MENKVSRSKSVTNKSASSVSQSVSLSVSLSIGRSVGSKQEKRPSKVKRMKDSGEEEGSCVSTYSLQCIRPSVMTNEWCHAESVESSSMSERA